MFQSLDFGSHYWISAVKMPIALWEQAKQRIKVNERELETRVTGNIAVLLIFNVES